MQVGVALATAAVGTAVWIKWLLVVPAVVVTLVVVAARLGSRASIRSSESGNSEDLEETWPQDERVEDRYDCLRRRERFGRVGRGDRAGAPSVLLTSFEKRVDRPPMRVVSVTIHVSSRGLGRIS